MTDLHETPASDRKVDGRRRLGDVDRTGLGPVAGRARATRTARTLQTAFADIVGAGAASVGAAAAVLYNCGPVSLRVLLASSAIIAAARCQRGSECLVHEGSHFNWTRKTKVNDYLTNAFAAWPVGMTVAAFRDAHRRHHDQFGSELDPDFVRYAELRIEAIDVSGGIASMLRSCAKLMPKYTLGWIRAAGMNKAGLAGLLGWQALTAGAISVVFGPHLAIGGLVAWAFSFLIVLPIVRFMGEAEEHTYTGASTVAEATVSNIGKLDRILVHPHGDGYHVAHHIWPQIPHHALPAFHRHAATLDPLGFGSTKTARRFRRSEL